MSDAKKKQGTHYLQVQNDFLMGGTAAVEKLWLGDKVSRDTLRLAIKDLEKKDPAKVQALKDWYSSTIGTRDDNIKPGEERKYKAQLTKDAKRAFIKLPLFEATKKGDVVRVRHSPDGEPLALIITPGLAGDVADVVDEAPEATDVGPVEA